MNPDPSRLLASLGVSELDELVYRSLLTRPGISLRELADRLSQHDSRVGAALRRLEHLGFVSPVDGRPKRFMPAMPDVAVESLVNARQQELLRVRAAVIELTAEYRAGRQDDPGELVEILTGEVAVARRFNEVQSSCTSELMLFDRPPYAAPPDNPRQRTVLKRGVRWRTIYSPESLEATGRRSHVYELIAAGEEARLLRGLPMKLAIVDRRVALLPLTLENGLQQSAVIHRSTLLDAMVTLFEVFWERALPIKGDRRSPGGPLTDTDRRLLSLMVTEAKDAAIARDLGIGVRTLRRRMQRLLQLLDADTRFQAGAQAVRRGWI
ncbi:MAG TPA: helix-turn-helix domain-containing protein [Nocardioidaceae bacterium]|nr:helix-turn-helix domain-containing protein [Nocardioidaceae bacterium]